MPNDLVIVDDAGEIIANATPIVPRQADSPTESLIRMAIEKGMNPTELYAILRDERAMSAKTAFGVAKAKFQSECPPVLKSQTNPQFSVVESGVRRESRFAPLDIMQTIADPHLHANGFSYDWRDASDQAPIGKVKVIFVLTHQRGHAEEYPCTITAPQKGGCSEPQKDGIAYEYARRQSFRNGTGIRVVGEDLDGNTDAGNANIASKADLDEIVRLIDESQASTPDFLVWAKCDTIAEFPADKVVEAKRMLAEKIRRLKQPAAAK